MMMLTITIFVVERLDIPFRQSFDDDGVSIDSEDDTVDGGLTCCPFFHQKSLSSCIQLFNDAIDDDGNDDGGNGDDGNDAISTADGAGDGKQEGYSDFLLNNNFCCCCLVSGYSLF